MAIESFGPTPTEGRFGVQAGLRPSFREPRTREPLSGSITLGSMKGLHQPQRQEGAIWFERDPTPRFILDFDGHILRANLRGRALIGAGVVGAGGLFICSMHRDRPRLDALLRRMADGQETEGRVLFRGGDDAWCLLELLATEDAPGRVFAAMRQASQFAPDKVEPLRAVFGLTKAETAVLSHLTIGEAPKDIGRKLTMSTHTVRAHLRAIFMKMGVKGINGTLRLTFQLAP